MPWTDHEGIWRFKDSCNVYAVAGDGGTVIVDAGTGRWLDHLDELPSPPVALLLTHFFRDHAAGAVRAASSRIPVFAPEWESELLEDPASYFARRDPYILYDSYWDNFIPIEPIPIAGVLRDHEVLDLAGLRVEVVPLPGATITQVGLEVALSNGEAVIFAGETIHSPGRVPRIAPLQYGYNDLPGAWNTILSAREIARRAPSRILPSLGEPISGDVDSALDMLQTNLRRLHFRRSFDVDPAVFDRPEFVQLSDNVWRTGYDVVQAYGTFVVSGGKILAIDSGWESFFGSLRPETWRRRPSIGVPQRLSKQLGTPGIDVVVPSHYHDDHVAAIPLLQRVMGTECWCPSWFSDILERPDEFAFPCLWQTPARIDRRLDPGVFSWEGVEFALAPMSGHTRFAALIGWEIDGVRFAHAGDQYHYAHYWRSDDPATGRRGWENDNFDPNHVYKNGADLDSYRKSAAWLIEWRPDVLLSGHQRPIWTDEAFFARLDEFGQEFEAAHQAVMPVGPHDIHFGIDHWAGWLRPYRVCSSVNQPIGYRATVRNPIGDRASLKLRLIGPEGWVGSTETVIAEAHAECAVELTIVPTFACRRRVIALELEANGIPFGQIAEALVTVGHERF